MDNITNSFKEAIKDYLEEQCKIDPCLKEKYKDTCLNGCVEYINKMAREELGGQNGAIKDDVLHFGKFTSAAQIDWDWSSDDAVDHTHALLHVLPNITSIDELMVWADLQVN